MKTLINNRIVFSLGIIAILVLGLVLTPTNAAFAYTNDYDCFNPSGKTYSAKGGKITFGDPDPEPATINHYHTHYHQGDYIVRTPEDFYGRTNNTDTRNSENLAGTAILGSSNSFLPSGLVQWTFFAVLVLVAVVLIRKISGSDQKYQEAPLKHS